MERAIRSFEGLVLSTSRMFAKQVRREEEDLAQELRIIVARAIEKWDPARSALPLRNYVYGAVANKMKDYKRDAQREHDRRARHGISFVAIEETRSSDDQSAAERFDALHHHTTHSAVYGRVDDLFVLPATITERECDVLLLLTLDLSKTEIVVRLGIARADVETVLASLRIKLADWAPSANGASTTKLQSAHNTARAVGAERTAQLAGSRAA